LVVSTVVCSLNGRAEVDDALSLLRGIAGLALRATVGADKGYGTRDFVEGACAADFTPHVAERAKGSAIDGRTTRQEVYAIGQRARKIIEEVFGWPRNLAGLRKVKHRGTTRVDWIVTVACAAYNLMRLRRLIPACPQAEGSFTRHGNSADAAQGKPRGLQTRPCSTPISAKSPPQHGSARQAAAFSAFCQVKSDFVSPNPRMGSARRLHSPQTMTSGQ